MTVYLVGAGPGQLELCTLRGAALLGRADVVVYDRLIARELLELAPQTAVMIDVGKTPGRPARQDDINDLLIEHGRAGREVVRLKGGDPFVFGRGGEEAEALRGAGVPFEVVPGVTSAFAAPAAAGIPVTHRGVSTSVTVVTGHVGDPSAPGGVDWDSLGRAGGTLVVLMGMSERTEIAAQLIKSGRDPSTPVAVVHWATTALQQVARTTLGGLADVTLPAPCTIVIGPVSGLDMRSPIGQVGHRDWQPSAAPLAGYRVVVTRTRRQVSELAVALKRLGARVVELPVISIEDALDGGVALGAAADRLIAGGYQWVACTSTNAVHRLVDAIGGRPVPPGVRWATVGPGTARSVAASGFAVEVTPKRSTADGLADAFPEVTTDDHGAGHRVLFPRAETVNGSLAGRLVAKGYTVDDVVAYRTVIGDPDERARVDASRADAIAFTSSSTVERTLELLGRERVPPVVVTIGPMTSGSARDGGLTVDVEASEHTISGLVSAVVDALSRCAPTAT